MDKDFLSREVFLTEIAYIKQAIHDLKSQSRNIPGLNLKLSEIENRFDHLLSNVNGHMSDKINTIRNELSRFI